MIQTARDLTFVIMDLEKQTITLIMSPSATAHLHFKCPLFAGNYLYFVYLLLADKLSDSQCC